MQTDLKAICLGFIFTKKDLGDQEGVREELQMTGGDQVELEKAGLPSKLSR